MQVETELMSPESRTYPKRWFRGIIIKPDKGRVREAIWGIGEDIIGYTKRYIKA